MKATYITKWTDKEFTFLEYEYRGHKYIVEINNAKGNEPLSWQHKNAHARIDREIELEEKEKALEADPNYKLMSALEAFDKLYNYWENDVKPDF